MIEFVVLLLAVEDIASSKRFKEHRPMTNKRYTLPICITLLVLLTGLACGLSLSTIPDAPPAPAPTAALDPRPPVDDLQVILQRLEVTYHGQDGYTYIGSGCPGNDRRGDLIDIHFTVAGVDRGKQVSRIVVAGNNTTLTWQRPCAGTGSWGLDAQEGEGGVWEIYVAPSEFAEIYTILFFYSDNSVAMGMVTGW